VPVGESSLPAKSDENQFAQFSKETMTSFNQESFMRSLLLQRLIQS